MALVIKDRVRETSVTSGTGTLTLAGAVTGFQTFAAIGNANTTYYCIADPVTGDWEVGIGTYSTTGPTLSRDTVLSNSAGTTAKITFSSNAKDVFCTYPSERAVTSNAGLTSTQVPYSNADGQLINSSNMTFDGTKLTVAGLKDSALTSGRVVFSTTSGEITDSGSLTWDGTYLTAGSIKDSALTSGRVTYAGASGLLTDSTNLTFNGTTLTANTLNLTNQLGTAYGGTGLTGFTAANNALYSTSSSALTAGTLPSAAGGTGLTGFTAANNALYSTSSSALTAGTLPVAAGGTGATTLTLNNVVLGNGTSAVQFVAPGANGNVLTSNGTTWTSATPSGASVTISNDTTTSTNLYPAFMGATTGTASTIYTGNAKLLYKPSTGEFQSSEVVAGNGLFVNSQTVSANYSIPSGSSAMSAGPVTVASGISVTVPSGSRWVVV